MAKYGVLLVNLGTPRAPDLKSIKHYLRQFLSDYRIIDLPFILRFLLVNGLIIPFRAKNTTLAYQKIWTPAGSPLLIHSQQLMEHLSIELGSDYQVALGMRYGTPSIPNALKTLNHCKKLIIFPLFPQYSSAATGSAIEHVLQTLSHSWNFPQIHIVQEFYDDPGYISAYAELIKKEISNKSIDMLLFSYHGLPLRHIKKSQCKTDCVNNNPCPAINEHNQFCYRAQCYTTSHLLAKALDLPSEKYQVCFQSRLGKTPWIKPYTDLILSNLIQQGIKKLAIACPSFVSDCLETLEEVNIRFREQWIALGGEEFTFVPCLNANPTWVKVITNQVKQATL